MEHMARSDMWDDAKHRPLQIGVRAMPQRGEIVHPYMFYTHMLCKRKAQFFRHTEYFLDVLQLYSSSSTGQWSLPCTSIKISAFLICGASRSDTRK